MLEHLLAGEFDVDPEIVGQEGFLREGRVYAYWGILLSLFRMPLLLFPNGLELDITPLSSLIAVSVAAAVKLYTVGSILRLGPDTPIAKVLYWALAVTLLFSGAQIQFLRPTVYQEVCLWAGTFAAIFVYYAVMGVLRRHFSPQMLNVMAIVSGLALLTRVSTGIMLCGALTLLLCATLLVRRHPTGASSSLGLATPFAILLMSIFLTGIVNYLRWGNPTIFADYSLYLMNSEFPDRLVRTKEYGLFNLSRVPLGVVYYFFPIWSIQTPSGKLILQDLQYQLLDSSELPPSTFLLTDPLLLILCAGAIYLSFTQRQSGRPDLRSTIAIAAGLLLGPILMLTAISMNFRYRIEFYPIMEFGAFIGMALIPGSPLTIGLFNRIRATTLITMLVGVLASHAALLLYKVSEFGPAIGYIKEGVGKYYMEALEKRFSKLLIEIPKQK